MSPEQAKGAREIDGRSDLFSVGVILYEFLCYRRPFEADSPTAVCYQIIAEPHPPLSVHLPACDKEIEAILNRALAKDPADRFADGEEMAAALSAFALRIAEREQELSARVKEMESELERCRAEARKVPAQPLLDPALLDDTLFPFQGELDERPREGVEDTGDEDYGYLLIRHAHLDKALQSMVRDLERVAPLIEQFERCKRQFDAGQWDECLAGVEELLKSCPRNPELLEMEKRCLERIEARRQEQERLERERKEIIRLIQQGEESQRKQDLEGALVLAEEALRLDEGNPEALALKQSAEAGLKLRRQAAELLAQARARLAESDFESALRIASEGLRIAPESGDFKQIQVAALTIRAQSAATAGDYTGCLAAVQAGLAIDPRSPQLKRLAKEAAEELKKREQAEAFLNEAREALAQGNHERAELRADEALRLRSDWPVAVEVKERAAEAARRQKAREFLHEAQACCTQGNYGECRRRIDSGLALLPQDQELKALRDKLDMLESLIRKASESLARGEYEKALEIAGNALEVDAAQSAANQIRKSAAEMLERKKRLEQLRIEAEKEFSRGKWQSCAEVCRSAMELGGENSTFRRLERESENKLREARRVESLAIQARERLDSEDFEEAIRLARELSELSPEDRRAEQIRQLAETGLDERKARLEQERQNKIVQLLADGQRELSAQRLRSARRLYNDLLRLEPDHADALTAREKIDQILSLQRRRMTRTVSLASVGMLALLGLVWVVRNPDAVNVRSDTPDPSPVVTQQSPIPPPVSRPPETKPEPPQTSNSNVSAIQEKLAHATTSLEAKDFASADRIATEILALSARHPQALEIQKAARQRLSQVTRLKQQIRRYLADSKYVEAKGALESVAALSAPDKDIQAFSEQIRTGSRRAADSARAETEKLRGRVEKGAVAAGISLAPAETLTTQAGTLYQSGDYTAAADRFVQARAAYAEIETKAAEILKGRRQEQRQAALNARQSFDRERAVAQQTEAEVFAKGPFSKARTAAADAENKFQQGDFSSAEKGYREAEALMREASNGARKAAEAQAAKQSEDQASRQRILALEGRRTLAGVMQGFSGEDARVAAEEAKAEQLLKEGRWSEASAAFERATRILESTKAETLELERIIGSYAAAFSGKDLKTLQALWPGMDRSNFESFRSTFEINESIQLRLKPVRYAFQDQKAVVTCIAELSYTPKRDSRELSLSSDSATFTMARAGDSWTIESFVGNYRGK